MNNGIKKIAWAFGICFILISLGINQASANARKDISLQVFYDDLSHYGDWVNNADYGYVWRPNVGSDFRPYYTNGHWVMTEYGNTWVSNYDWGWAPFHYGRWFYDNYDGWVWLPDTEWGPAWVSWRTGGGYYGWAPLAPRMSININIGRRHYIPNNYWVFIPQRCIYYPSYSRYWEPRRNVYIINNTTIINHVYTNNRSRYYSGPSRDDVRRATRSEVPVYRVADNSRPGSSRITRDEVNIYRPNVDRSANAAPRTVASNATRPSREDNTVNRTVDNSRGTSSSARPERSAGSTDRSENNVSRPNVERSVPSSSSSRPERAEAPKANTPAPRTTEATRSSSPAPTRTEAPSSRPQRVERSEPRTQSAPSRSVERSAPSSPNTRSSSSSSSSSRSSRPSR